VILVTQGNKEWLLSCSYSQSDKYGDGYSQYVGGRQMNWPVEASTKAIDKVEVLKRIFDVPEYQVSQMLHIMNAKEIRDFLKV
jgi:hypothetical protein